MKTENKFILAGNGPYENHGCEAIVRGTAEILRQYFENPRFVCTSFFNNPIQFINQTSHEQDSSITHKTLGNIRRWTLKWAIFRLSKIFPSSSILNLLYPQISREMKDTKAVLCVGGDNYSLEYGKPAKFLLIDNLVLLKRKYVIIWGASVGPFSDDPDYEKSIIKHLKKLTAVFLRESYTYNYLSEKGLKNIYLTADPAFVMPAEKPKNITIEPGCIGLNFSPLYGKYAGKDWLNTAGQIIAATKKITGRKIYLIPHVNWGIENNDYEFMKSALSASGIKEGIEIIPPIYSASELKWIISQMTVFAGARTHSTIAAMSSCVPTISFAYSAKAIGINRDIFGNEDFVISHRNINPYEAAEKIKYILDNGDAIRTLLAEKIPIIKARAMSAGQKLKDIINV